jgi:hypothetical protein
LKHGTNVLLHATSASAIIKMLCTGYTFASQTISANCIAVVRCLLSNVSSFINSFSLAVQNAAAASEAARETAEMAKIAAETVAEQVSKRCF